MARKGRRLPESKPHGKRIEPVSLPCKACGKPLGFLPVGYESGLNVSVLSGRCERCRKTRIAHLPYRRVVK